MAAEEAAATTCTATAAQAAELTPQATRKTLAGQHHRKAAVEPDSGPVAEVAVTAAELAAAVMTVAGQVVLGPVAVKAAVVPPGIIRFRICQRVRSQ